MAAVVTAVLLLVFVFHILVSTVKNKELFYKGLIWPKLDKLRLCMIARARQDKDIFIKRMRYIRVTTVFDYLASIHPCWDVMVV